MNFNLLFLILISIFSLTLHIPICSKIYDQCKLKCNKKPFLERVKCNKTCTSNFKSCIKKKI